MMKVIGLTALAIIIVSSFHENFGQDLKYSVMWKGDSVGHVIADRYDSADFDVYKIDSEVRFWFFGSRVIKYTYRTLYRQDTLIRAFTRYTRNGDLKAESSISINGNGYDVMVDGDHSLITHPHPIDRSVTAIYHNEPVTLKQIFSERWGTLLKVESPGPNHYFIEKPDGRSTEYFFEDGICRKVVIENFFATFTFERSE